MPATIKKMQFNVKTNGRQRMIVQIKTPGSTAYTLENANKICAIINQIIYVAIAIGITTLKRISIFGGSSPIAKMRKTNIVVNSNNKQKPNLLCKNLCVWLLTKRTKLSLVLLKVELKLVDRFLQLFVAVVAASAAVFDHLYLCFE